MIKGRKEHHLTLDGIEPRSTKVIAKLSKVIQGQQCVNSAILFIDEGDYLLVNKSRWWEIVNGNLEAIRFVVKFIIAESIKRNMKESKRAIISKYYVT